jgi:hypothetical protein
MKTYSEMLARRTTLAERLAEIQKLQKGYEEDRAELITSVAEFSQVYGFSVDFDAEEDDDIVQMNFRQPISLAQNGQMSFKDQVLLIDGVTEVQELDRYTLQVRKGRAFIWGEIKSKLEDAWGAYCDPIIKAADELSARETAANDAPTGDIAEGVDPAIAKAEAELQTA